jgi:hypothetical protein
MRGLEGGEWMAHYRRPVTPREDDPMAQFPPKVSPELRDEASRVVPRARQLYAQVERAAPQLAAHEFAAVSLQMQLKWAQDHHFPHPEALLLAQLMFGTRDKSRTLGAIREAMTLGHNAQTHCPWCELSTDVLVEAAMLATRLLQLLHDEFPLLASPRLVFAGINVADERLNQVVTPTERDACLLAALSTLVVEPERRRRYLEMSEDMLLMSRVNAPGSDAVH